MKLTNFKRIILLFACVCMIFSISVAAAATGTEDISSQPDASLAFYSSSDGTTVTVVVDLTSTNIALSGIDFRLEFDNSNLTLTGVTGSIFSFSFTSYDKANISGYVNALGYLGSGDTTTTGTIATFIFSAKETSAKENVFRLTRGSGSDTKGNTFDLTLPNAGNEVAETYKICKGFTANGALSVDTSALAGSIVTIIVKPVSGYYADSVAVIDTDNVSIPVSKNSENYVFRMPKSDVTVNVTFKENPNFYQDNTSKDTETDDSYIAVENEDTVDVTDTVSKEDSNMVVSGEDDTTAHSDSTITDSLESDSENSADFADQVTKPQNTESMETSYEETPKGNVLLWILPTILVVLIAVLVVLLIVRKKRLTY